MSIWGGRISAFFTEKFEVTDGRARGGTAGRKLVPAAPDPARGGGRGRAALLTQAHRSRSTRDPTPAC